MYVGFMIGITTLKNVLSGVHPSIIAASSTSKGMDLINPQNMNTARPVPNPRYTITIPHGVVR